MFLLFRVALTYQNLLLIIDPTILMAYYPPQCLYTNCYYGCCDINGNCPSFSYDCYYYYEHTISAGAIVGIAVGAFLFIATFFIILYACRRWRRRR